jgi:hypothetical protein
MRIRIYVKHVQEMHTYIYCLASLRGCGLALLRLRFRDERAIPAFIIHGRDIFESCLFTFQYRLGIPANLVSLGPCRTTNVSETLSIAIAY